MEKPTQLPSIFPVKCKLPISVAQQHLRTKTRVKSIHTGFDARNARNASDGPDMNKRPRTALNFESTTKAPLQMGVQQLIDDEVPRPLAAMRC